MAENRKHHYVPRFLLKRFSSNGKGIGIYNIASRKLIPIGNLYNQCYTPYLYGKDNAMERELAEVEGDLAHLLRVMDQVIEPPPPCSEPHKLMLFFVLSQRGRTQYAADAMDEMLDKMVKNIYGEMFVKEHGIDLNKFKVSLKEAAQASLAVALSGFPLLLDMGCKMLVNKTGDEFIISDNPVVFYNQLMSFRKFGSNCGMACKGLKIFVPIDPNKTLLLYDQDVYRVGKGDRNIVEITNPNDIYELNTLQFVAARENIYFKNPAFKVEPLHKKAEPFLRKVKANLDALGERNGEDGHRSSLIATYSEDVRTNLALSFLKLSGPAKHWRGEFKKQKFQPAAVVRNKALVDEHERFMEVVKAGRYTFMEFDRYMADKIKAEEAIV